MLIKIVSIGEIGAKESIEIDENERMFFVGGRTFSLQYSGPIKGFFARFGREPWFPAKLDTADETFCPFVKTPGEKAVIFLRNGLRI